MTRRWLWLLWWLSLLLCPATALVFGLVYDRTGKHNPFVPQHWSAKVVLWLGWVQLTLWIIAFIAVMWLAKTWTQRGLAWAAFFVVAWIGVLMLVGAAVNTQGQNF